MTVTRNGKEITVEDNERQPCEIYSRVMGYYRPITVDAYNTTEWNKGKVSEHRDRILFRESKVMRHISPHMQ